MSCAPICQMFSAQAWTRSWSCVSWEIGSTMTNSSTRTARTQCRGRDWG